MHRIPRTIFVAMLFTTLLGAFQPEAQAQSTTRFGVKGGLTASTLFIDNVDNRKERIGFHAGLFAQAPITSALAIQPELLYVTKGASADFDFIVQGRNSFNLNYAELPVLLTFKLGSTAELQVGPYAAYLINANLATEINGGGTRSLAIDRDDLNKVDYGLAGGLNIYFGKALIGLRYGQGLNRIAGSTAARALLGDAKNAVGLVSIGFSLN